MTTSRRRFLRNGTLAGGALALSPWRALHALADTGAGTDVTVDVVRAPNNGGLGVLVDAGPELALPGGFRYVRFGGEGTPMANGKPTPPCHDGMAAFAGPGGALCLVRNHEIGGDRGPFGGKPYDAGAGGGVVNLVFDPGSARLLATYPVLTGTAVNCSGGRTPWGTWLTCEETVAGPGDGYGERHGYCFEVPPKATGPVQATPLRAMGRFKREAVCVNPATGTVFQTEDEAEAGFYRFLPKVKGALAAGGQLQMLGIAGQRGYDLGHGHPVGTTLQATWIDIPEADPAQPESDGQSVFGQGRSRGGAAFRRLEGCYWHNGRAVIVSTTGGRAEIGQVWEYRPGDDTLRLLFESPSADVLKMPDNVAGAPWGGLVLCEDGPGPDHIRGLTRSGQIFTIARNRFSDGEFAGATFSPDGRWLFVNVQSPGATFGITGPWGKIP